MKHSTNRTDRTTNVGWLRIAVVGSSLAALAVAGASATQAFADQGHAGAGHQLVTAHHGHATKAKGGAATRAASRHTNTPADGSTDTPGTDDPVDAPDDAAGAALSKAVSTVVSGTISDVQGHDVSADEYNPAFSLASLDVTSSDGSPAGDVTVAWQPEDGYGGEPDAAHVQAWLKTCNGLPECHTQTLPDGSLVRISTERQTLDSGTLVTTTVERDIDGTVEVLSTTNRDESANIVGPDTALTADQLVQVASHLAPLG